MTLGGGGAVCKMATVVLDNGACTAKVGYSTDDRPRVMPNCVMKARNIRTRIFVGDQLDECKDPTGLFYLLAFQKGYLVNWEIQRQVWDYMFGKSVLNVSFSDANLIVTEPHFNFTSIQETTNEVLFEEYGFDSILRCNATWLSQNKIANDRPKNKCCIVVDSGYSFTHIVPYCDGRKVKEAVKRINVGGKLLTNRLKEVISYRQLMVMDETHVMNQCKEDVCYVSTDFYKDTEKAKKKGKDNTIVRDYVLPDYTHIKRGHVRSPDDSSSTNDGAQMIRMNIERFSVPEILFHPSDVDIQEMGIPEAIVYCISLLPEEMHPHFYSNIWLVGGNCLLPGFRERVESDLRALIPDEYDLNVYLPDNPLTHSWEGGVCVAKQPDLKSLMVTKEEFDEYGHNICLDKFDI